MCFWGLGVGCGTGESLFEAFGVFGILFVKKGIGFGNIAERVPPKYVAVSFCADMVVAVIYAGDGDLIEKGRILDLVAVNDVVYVEKTI